MSIDVEVLCEAFTILKQYIPTKDRQEASDNLMSSMVDMLSDHELKDFAASDTHLLRALKEYTHDEDEDLEADLDE
jgi:hypothetical protein